MRVTSFVTGAFQENAYLIVDEGSMDAVLVDPGADGDELVAGVRKAGLRLTAIWVTHGHVDHIGGIAAVRRAFDVPILLHQADFPMYERGAMVAQMYGIPFEDPPPPDQWIAEGEVLHLGALTFDVMHTPGHAPGHVVFHRPGVAFVGDCLFAGSIGRTDLPLADGAQLMDSLRRIAQLPEDTVVYPGHGPSTTIGAELANNPFLRGVAGPLR